MRQLRRSGLFVANGSYPAKSPVGAAASASMPLLRSFDFLPFVIYKDGAPLGLGKARLALRDCLETTRGAVFGEKAGWRGATKENIPGGSSTEEQRSQTAFSAKTLRAAGLLSVAGVGSFLTARCGALRAAKAALATAKIPRRSAPRSFQTGS